MHSKSNIVSESPNIMNLRDLPSSLYSVFGRRVLSLSPARDFSVFIDLSLSPWGQITETWNCTFKPLRNYSWGNTVSQLCFPPRTQELQGPGHQLANSQVKLSYFSSELLRGLFLSTRASVIITQWWSAACQQLLSLERFGTGHRAGLSSLLCTFPCWFTNN